MSTTKTIGKKYRAILLSAGVDKDTTNNPISPSMRMDNGKPRLLGIIESLKSSNMIDEIVIIVGHKKEYIMELVSSLHDVLYYYNNLFHKTGSGISLFKCLNTLPSKDTIIIKADECPTDINYTELFNDKSVKSNIISVVTIDDNKSKSDKSMILGVIPNSKYESTTSAMKSVLSTDSNPFGLSTDSLFYMSSRYTSKLNLVKLDLKDSDE